MGACVARSCRTRSERQAHAAKAISDEETATTAVVGFAILRIQAGTQEMRAEHKPRVVDAFWPNKGVAISRACTSAAEFTLHCHARFANIRADTVRKARRIIPEPHCRAAKITVISRLSLTAPLSGGILEWRERT
jgi:hypothetical protein